MEDTKTYTMTPEEASWRRCKAYILREFGAKHAMDIIKVDSPKRKMRDVSRTVGTGQSQKTISGRVITVDLSPIEGFGVELVVEEFSTGKDRIRYYAYNEGTHNCFIYDPLGKEEM